ncbi:Mov34/MPN/PAD-1 family protein [Paraburkholderia sp. C35]|uniref:Mov34/MPN/PAD-1 family protein n=1 Tax=Paraburkholderia sp. C35 TaxID=2126993 RepID=UPI000D688534|nr:Mov34/MPN/PAD-1 family protein [Paraburkholderia sp. C35]
MTALWLGTKALIELKAEARRMFPLETGGVLVGYVGLNGEPVVQHVIGPGERAQHKRERFEPDHDWQCLQLDQMYRDSSGQFVYLGDWHTHPNGNPQMSWLDKRTLRGIARHRESGTSQPLMLIGAGAGEDWMWRAHRYRGTRLKGLAARFDSLEIRSFEG